MEDSHPAILSAEQWDRLQEKMKENRRDGSSTQDNPSKYQN